MDPLHRLKMAPERKMALSFGLRQALEILQMPQQQLCDWLQDEVDKNPMLELSQSFGSKEILEIADSPSLYEYLSQQIRDTLSDPYEQKIALEIIGYFDERGFFSTPIEELAALFQLDPEKILSILIKIQSFDPPGIGARNLQESLLIQLRRQKDKGSTAYRLVENYFDELLHGRYTQIKKKMGAEPQDLSRAIQKLARLQLRPASGFKEIAAPTASVDLRALKIDQQWIVELADEEFFQVGIRSDVESCLPQLSAEEKKSVRTWMSSAKWLLRSLSRRKSLLLSIASHLLMKQSDYLDRKGPLQDVGVEDLALLLGVHESTIHRALSGKLIEGPWGVVPVRSLLSQTASTDDCKKILQQLIAHENKGEPLTDEEFAAALQKKGIPLARRTVAKYRRDLKLGSALQRKILLK